MNQMNQNHDQNLTQKLGLVMGISIIMLLIALGVVHIRNSGIPLPGPIIMLMFAMCFITGTIYLEHRGGEFPWILLGGGLMAVTVSVIVTCVFSGIVFVVTGKILDVPWEDLAYSLSVCMIVSVIALNVIPYIPGWILQLTEKTESDDERCNSHCESDYFFDDDGNDDTMPVIDGVSPDQGPPEDCGA